MSQSPRTGYFIDPVYPTTIDIIAQLVHAKNPELGLAAFLDGGKRTLLAIKGSKPEDVVLTVVLENGPKLLLEAQEKFISRL